MTQPLNIDDIFDVSDKHGLHFKDNSYRIKDEYAMDLANGKTIHCKNDTEVALDYGYLRYGKYPYLSGNGKNHVFVLDPKTDESYAHLRNEVDKNMKYKIVVTVEGTGAAGAPEYAGETFGEALANFHKEYGRFDSKLIATLYKANHDEVNEEHLKALHYNVTTIDTIKALDIDIVVFHNKTHEISSSLTHKHEVKWEEVN